MGLGLCPQKDQAVQPRDRRKGSWHLPVVGGGKMLLGTLVGLKGLSATGWLGFGKLVTGIRQPCPLPFIFLSLGISLF